MTLGNFYRKKCWILMPKYLLKFHQSIMLEFGQTLGKIQQMFETSGIWGKICLKFCWKSIWNCAKRNSQNCWNSESLFELVLQVSFHEFVRWRPGQGFPTNWELACIQICMLYSCPYNVRPALYPSKCSHRVAVYCRDHCISWGKYNVTTYQKSTYPDINNLQKT